MDKIILGLTGKIGSGKDTVAKYLVEKYGGIILSFSSFLNEVLDIYDLPITRENQQKLSTILRQNFTEDILANAIEKRIKNSSDNLIAIPNVRRGADIEDIKKLSGFNLIFVDADPKTRYDRNVKRNQTIGDNTMTYKEFLKKDNAEAEEQIEGLKETANFVITNNGTLKEFYTQIDDIWEKMTK